MTTNDRPRPKREHPGAGTLRYRHAVTDDDAAHTLNEEVRDPRGGQAPVHVLMQRRAALHADIDRDRRDGSRRHERISRFQRALATGLPILDGAVLFWFLIGVLNVDLRRVDVTLLVAAALAVLASTAVAAWNARLGHHLQTFTDDDRRVVWAGLDVTTVVMLIATAIMWLGLGVMMTLRVEEEVYQATGRRDLIGWVIALALAGALILINAYVLHLALSDGSPVTRELDALGQVLRRPLRRLDQLRRRSSCFRHRLVVRAEAIERIHPETGPRQLTSRTEDHPPT